MKLDGARPGVTLPELVLVAWLFSLVLLATARFAGAQAGLVAGSQDRVRAADAMRTADLVLTAELRYTTAADRVTGSDSVRLRAVRGSGVVCPGGSGLHISYRGVRRPDPSKDSVALVTDGATGGTVHALDGAVADPTCGDYRLMVDPPVSATAGLALVFETGAYYLTDGALRYRRGRGGRQPVTETVLEAGRFHLYPTRLEARIRLRADSLPRIGGGKSIAVIPLLNRAGTP